MVVFVKRRAESKGATKAFRVRRMNCIVTFKDEDIH